MVILAGLVAESISRLLIPADKRTNILPRKCSIRSSLVKIVKVQSLFLFSRILAVRTGQVHAGQRWSTMVNDGF
jgi:hypothetical protein